MMIVISNQDYQSKVLDHYFSVWGAEFEQKNWPHGPVAELPTHFSVLEFKPHINREMWTYATCGMSMSTYQSPIEIHMFSKVQDDSIVELLSMVAITTTRIRT